MPHKLIVTGINGALDWKDVVITANGHSCTLDELYDTFHKLVAERDQLQARMKELEDEVHTVWANVADLKQQLSDAQGKYEMEHDAYMDLFCQLSEYERQKLGIPAATPSENGGTK